MTAPTPENEIRQDDWTPCEHGELVGVVTRRRATTARQNRARLAGGAIVLGGLVLAMAFLPGVGSDSGPFKGGISCQECLAAMPDYHEQLVAGGELAGIDLTAEQVRAVTAHLEDCSLCRGHFEKAYPGALAGAVAAASVGWGLFTVRRRRG